MHALHIDYYVVSLSKLKKIIILYNGKNGNHFHLVYFSYPNALRQITDLVMSRLLFYEVILILVIRAEKQRHY